MFYLIKSTIPFILVIQLSISYAQEINKDVEQLLLQAFGVNSEISFSKIDLDKKIKDKIEKKIKQKFYSNSVYFYNIKLNGSTVGYALLDNVYGKSLPITFLVIFNIMGSIKSSHIVKYREQYGVAVKNESWNNQFVGKNADSSFEVGKDISSISGATISVNSVTKGIQKLSHLIKEITKSSE